MREHEEATKVTCDGCKVSTEIFIGQPQPGWLHGNIVRHLAGQVVGWTWDACRLQCMNAAIANAHRTTYGTVLDPRTAYRP